MTHNSWHRLDFLRLSSTPMKKKRLYKIFSVKLGLLNKRSDGGCVAVATWSTQKIKRSIHRDKGTVKCNSK
jgi:hypothetical protein